MTRPTKISNWTGDKDKLAEYIRDVDNDLKQLYAKFHSFLSLNSLEVGASNTYASLGASGDLLFVGSGSGLPYGEIYVNDNTTSDTVATATNSQVTRFDTNGVYNSMTPDHTNDHITIVKAGIYLCATSIAFSGDGSVQWAFSAYKNNGNTEFANIHADRKLGAAGDVGSASMSGLIDLAVGDTIEVWMMHTAGVNKDIIIRDCTLSLIQVGGT
jgi:hypothetical protein